MLASHTYLYLERESPLSLIPIIVQFHPARVVVFIPSLSLFFKTLVVFGNYDGMTPMASLLAAPVEEFEPPAPLNPSDAVAIIYTTGTTGRAKGSVISHRNIVSQMIISG